MPSPARLLALGVLLGVLPSLHGSATPPQQQPAPKLPAGQVIDSVRTLENPSQSYALYLPSTYAPDRAWPLLMAFDPSAEGAVPVKLFREAAEKYGYIVVGSNNSKNGPTRPSAEAFDALWRDVHTRFRVDDRRIYAAGFSGAARFSSLVASSCQGCLAGVILSGAGFPPDHPPSSGLKFVVYAAIGHYDFNFPEMVQLRQALERGKITHHIDVFDGSHQWMPPALAQAALEWLNLQAMASGVLPRDEAFVAAQWAQRLQQAQAEEHNHDLYQAFHSYSSLAADFGPLRDVGEARAAAERLRRSPEFRRAQASLDDQVRKQNSITAPIIARMISLASNPNGGLGSLPQVQQPPMQPNPEGRPSAGAGDLAQDSSSGPEMVRQQLEGELTSLRKQRERETNPEKLTVLRRALGAVFAEAYDSGYTMLDSKNYRAAAAYFELATFAVPKASAEMHYNAAAAYCLAGDRKQSMRVLRQAVAEGFHDRARLEQDRDFDRLRSSPEFQAVLANLAPK
jgi:dienelactone hydrolase